MAEVIGVLQGVPRSVLPLEKAPHSGTPQKPEGGQGEPCTQACEVGVCFDSMVGVCAARDVRGVTTGLG